MDLVRAVIYGIIQGLTEFLPVSSNAHIRIVPALLGWEDPGAGFTAVIQLGTTLAVLIYFAKDLKRVISGWASSLGGKNRDTIEAKMGWGVFWGTIPIIILGLGLHSKIETTFRSLYYIAFSLIAMGVVMFIADRQDRARRHEADLEVKDGIIVGFWQCLSLLPGMSRSGSTISGGLFQGLDRSTAARFSFLLGIPSITAAGLYEAFKERKAITGELMMPTLVATAVSFVVGYAAIALFIQYLQKRGITPFVVYRLILGVLLLVLLQKGTLHADDGAKDVKQKETVSLYVPKNS